MVSLLRSLINGKKSILNSEPLNNSEEHNPTSKNVTAKTARKMFVLKMLKPPNVERSLVEQNLSNYPSRSQWKTNLDVSNIRWYITFYLLTTIFTK